MTARERANEILHWLGEVRDWSDADLRDRIEAAIIAATEDAEARVEAAEKALEEMTKVAKAMAGNYGQDGGP